MAKSLQEKKLPVECHRVAYWVLCFFLVFINDLPDYCVNLKTMLFSDDAKFINSGQAQEQIQTDLNNVFNWTIEYNMPFNLDKSTYLKLGKMQKIFTSTDSRS